ncbi:heparinase II/III family protein [Roseobacter sinensis]|uniref:Heparinase II/III family protein n=1 Tax=Roseobacter sinensis TaxID=2931391 RepID=A0ABT3B9L2_9RHOB|nr:heparinase II/III family protein [Roseobacter sp. WL0113]MCV3270256.1 heparinase II/III family protein [Roseobacter sp. WL0113]
MSEARSFAARKAQFLNRWHAARAGRMRARAVGFVSAPEPRTIGSFARGRQLLAGNFLFAGHLLEHPDTDLWDLPAPNAEYEQEIHGFAWLDDLAAVGDHAARAAAQRWVWSWMDRYGRGRGPGWTPDLTGRRLIRWINHALFMLQGNDAPDSDAFYRSLNRQTHFLARRWQGAASGLPRFEALTGLIYASLALEGMDAMAAPAVKALARECRSQIDAQGGLPTRNPEELLDVFTLLTWAAAALSDAGQAASDAHLEAIERIAPTLRTLRHADGGLARFHGGGRGPEGWLDHALAQAKAKTRQPDGLSMGFARLSAGRTSVIVDASKPPTGRASYNAHASTLALELTSGRRPLVVNCGSGRSFGPDWRRAGRATPSHSTLSLDGYSSARLGEAERGTGREELIEGPIKVPIEIGHVSDGLRFQGGHDGFSGTHGLIHARTLEMTFDGRGMAGEDMLLALTDAEKKRFDLALDATGLQGIAFDIRFHLHPEVDATLDLGGAAVSMALKSGEIWVFRHDGAQTLALQPSVYLESGRLKPRSSNQIVLSGRAMSYATRVRWSLAKAQETAIGVRDLSQDTANLTDEP